MKKIISVLVCFIMIFGFVPDFGASADTGIIELYVSPDGDDSASGTFEKPLASLQGAKDKVAVLKKEGVPVNVYFRGGEYFFDDTVKFDKKDSGTKNAPVTYTAYGNEEPVFSGAVKVETEDFERVNEDMYQRLPKVSRDFVGVADLKKLGVKNLTDFTAESVIGGLGSQGFVAVVQDANVEFYFNNRSMTLAEWPNGLNEYAKITKIISDWEFGGETNGRIKNWVNAENLIMLGFIRVGFGQVRAKVMDIDLEEETFIFQKNEDNDGNPYYNEYVTKHRLGDTPKIGGDWKVQNLIEELDAPGEFYVDYDDLKLYFYPPYSTVGVDMRLAVGQKPIIQMNKTENITFSNIIFEKNRENVIELTSTNNIKFLSCKVQHFAMRGIVLTEQCRNTVIDGCDFFSAGNAAVTLNDISREENNFNQLDNVKLKAQNNIVNNCHFWNISTQFSSTTSTGAVNVCGVGNMVKNCKFHNSVGNVIYWTGNDHTISNNEFCNVMKYVRDQGGIYNGRSLIQRGVEIAYNYFHDIDTTSDDEGYARCFYNDDTLGGTYHHHNILVNVEQGYNLAGGTDTKFDYNIVAMSEVPGTFGSHGYGESQFKDAYEFFRKRQLPTVYSLDAYKKYENMHRIFFGRKWPGYGASFKGNLFYGNEIKDPVVAEGAIIGGARPEDSWVYQGNDYQKIFNDPDNGDFTIKEDYELPEGYESLKDIKLEKIGIYESETRKSINKPLADFKLYYPYNYTENLNGTNVMLKWEESIGADEYFVEIALDEDFNNVVSTYNVPCNYLVADDLDNDLTEYYWRVTAIANGKDCKERKLNSGGPRRFRTQEFDVLDKSMLEVVIKKAEDVISKVSEGVERGDIAFGSTNNLKHHLNTARELMGIKSALQSEIDTIVNLMEKEMEDIGKTVVRAYAGIDNIISAKDSWITNTEGGGLSHIDDGIILDNSSDKVMTVYTNVSAPIERNKLFCFKLNINIPDGAEGGQWQAIAFQRKEDAGIRLYDGTDYGYLFLIKSATIEIQLWNGVKQRIIDTIPNTLPKGEDADIKFGVLDFGAGQTIILEVNGITVFEHSEYDDLLRDDLYFSVYDSPKSKKGIMNCKELILKTADKEDIPEDDIQLGNRLSVGENDMLEVIKSIANSDEIRVKNDVKISSVKTNNLKEIGFKIKPNLSESEQGVMFRVSDKQFNINSSDYYMLSFKNNKLILKKNMKSQAETLSIIKTDAIKSNEWNDISIYTVYKNNSVHIIVHSAGQEIINCVDTQPIKNEGYFGVFNNSTYELLVKP